MSGEHVLVCVAWPYANGPLHLGHVAGCYLPPDIQTRFERAKGNKVLLVSGSDEHGTPITVTAETMGIDPQSVVDKYHALNIQALKNLGCVWEPNVDTRGPEYGGALFNRTSDKDHHAIVSENFIKLLDAGLFERKVMQQYYEVRSDGGRFLPDRYVEGICPGCKSEGARGDQCDTCGITYEAHELLSPKSKMNPEADIEIRDTEHLFYRLDVFQKVLEEHSKNQQKVWKANVRAMTKQWLDMGLRPRAVTRDLSWGIPLPLDGDEWLGKCIYVWFEAVQGYYSCAKLWAKRYAKVDDWEKWWKISPDGKKPRHLYFLGKDNIPFHTIIWPSIIMGLNHANKGLDFSTPPSLPGPGELHLEDNVPAMEYLMLAGGQFSKSRKHAIWLPSFLERFDPDTLRYYLSINMPENHDTDFNWPDFVERVNAELIAAYGNFVHRVLTLGNRLPESTPLHSFEDLTYCNEEINKLESLHAQITSSLERHRFKEALRFSMNAAQLGNQMLQNATPWTYLNDLTQDGSKESMAKLSFGWRLCRYLAITMQPFLPFSSEKLWKMLGENGKCETQKWYSAIDWDCAAKWNNHDPKPLFNRLDLNEILEQEKGLAEISDESNADPSHNVKGTNRKKEGKKMPEGTTHLDFETFTKVELRTGKIIEVKDHDNADKLYVVKIDDGSEVGRTICAGLKEYYSPDQMVGKSIVFVANLKPRKLRGILSEGMMLAADNGKGGVTLVTLDGDIEPGSEVR